MRRSLTMTETTHQGPDFSITIAVDQAPVAVFRAIVNPREWWSRGIDGRTDVVGAEFTYRYEDAHLCKIRVTELVPGERVAWLVVDNYFNFTEDKSEWKGTQISFDLAAEAAEADKTEIRFTHRGLVPDYECYDMCSNSWDFYLRTSLRALIRTGRGVPNLREDRLSLWVAVENELGERERR
jgi:uncharacterized protein YndB with AHSA1/START domain